jgi:hypothetical protein
MFKRAERTCNGAEHGMYLRESLMRLMIRRLWMKMEKT